MAMICIKHATWNCQTCYPLKTPAPAPTPSTSGGVTSRQPQAGKGPRMQVATKHSRNKSATPQGTTAASATLPSTSKVVAVTPLSVTPASSAASGGTVTALPSTTTTFRVPAFPVVKMMPSIKPGTATAALYTFASSATRTPVVSTTGAVGSTAVSKRVGPSSFPRMQVTSSASKRRTAATTSAAKKKIKKSAKTAGSPPSTIIDDEVACQIFRELGITDEFLNSGKVLAWALPPDDEAFMAIHEYVDRGQVHNFGVQILSILRVIAKADNLDESPLDFNEDPKAAGKQRMMLWHGTRKDNVASILQDGLRLPTVKAQMFGTGIYFADRITKSSQYCYSVVGGCAYLFLCDVLLGDMFRSQQAMSYLKAPPIAGSKTFDSVKGCGRNVPDKEWARVIDNCVWPLGPTVMNKDPEDFGGSSQALPMLQYNEYIVYNSDQVRPKYLVKVKFTPQPYHEYVY